MPRSNVSLLPVPFKHISDALADSYLHETFNLLDCFVLAVAPIYTLVISSFQIHYLSGIDLTGS